jgi:hypothetical protein
MNDNAVRVLCENLKKNGKQENRQGKPAPGVSELHGSRCFDVKLV